MLLTTMYRDFVAAGAADDSLNLSLSTFAYTYLIQAAWPILSTQLLRLCNAYADSLYSLHMLTELECTHRVRTHAVLLLSMSTPSE